MEDQGTYSSQVVFLTDANSVLQAWENPKNKDLNATTTALMNPMNTAKAVILQFIHDHVGIEGNEAVDEL